MTCAFKSTSWYGGVFCSRLHRYRTNNTSHQEHLKQLDTIFEKIYNEIENLEEELKVEIGDEKDLKKYVSEL